MTCLNLWDVALAFVLIILILVTIVGNLLVVASVCIYKRMRTFTNVLLVSLATSDLLVGLLITPLALVDQLYEHNWQYSFILCTSWATSDVLLCTASILNLCAISIDRYFAITSPLRYTRTRTMRMAGSLVAVVWVISLIVCTPPWLVPQWKFEAPYVTTPKVDPVAPVEPALMNVDTTGTIYSSTPQYMVTTNASLTDLIPELTADMYGDLNPDSNPDEPKPFRCSYSNAIGYRVYSALCSFYIPLLIMLFVYVRIFQVASNRENQLNQMAKTSRSQSTAMRVFVGNKDTRCNGSNTLQPKSALAGHNKRSFSPEKSSSGRTRHDYSLPKKSVVNRNLNLHESEELDSMDSPEPMRPDRPHFSRQNRISRAVSNNDGISTNRYASVNSSLAEADSVVDTLSTARTKDSLDVDDEDSMVLMSTPEVSHLTKQARQWYQKAVPSSLMFKASATYGKTKPGGKQKQDREKQLYMRERKALKTIGIVVSGFIICWLPFFIFYLVALSFGEEEEENKATQVLGDIFLWLGYSNSAINPLIYTFYNRDFRRCFRDILLCGCCKTGIRRGRMSVRLLHQSRPTN